MRDTGRNREIRKGKKNAKASKWEKFRDENRQKSRNVEINWEVWKEGKTKKKHTMNKPHKNLSRLALYLFLHFKYSVS
jgi:hypothetical protein